MQSLRLLCAVVVFAVVATGCSAAPSPGAGPILAEAPAQPPAAEDVEPSETPQSPRAQASTASSAPVAGDTPAKLARQILRAEQLLRSDDTRERELDDAGHLQQVAYRKLAEKPRWDDRVLRRLPRWLRTDARANVYAHRQLLSMSSGPPPKSLPQWRIIAPAKRKELRGYYRKAQRNFGVRWQYLAAIHLVETRMGRIRGVSTAGAKGPMQFIDATWASYGRGDVWDNHDAIMAAGRYLRARGAPGNMDRALYSYNNDVRYVRAVKAYAGVMKRNPTLYRGYYHWQVYYRQKGGAVWLPVGYDGRKR